MAGLKEIRGRISTVKTTMQVTSAMKMVSAAKLKKAQNVLLRSRPYTQKLFETLTHLLSDEETRKQLPYFKKEVENENVLFLIVTSNRGLCGGFNSGLIKLAVEHIVQNYSNSKVDILSIGRQGEKILRSKKFAPTQTRHELFDELTFDAFSDFSAELTNLYLDGTYSKIVFAYTAFISAGKLEITFDDFLPFNTTEDNTEMHPDDYYIYEPDKALLISEMIPKALQMNTYMMLLNSYISEYAARMQAMQQATDNAKSLIRELTLQYNKERQSNITNEILEITGGAEALKKK